MGWKCPEQAKEYRRQWYLRNKEYVLQKNREWIAANPDKKREQDRRYREKDPEGYLERQRARTQRYAARYPGRTSMSSRKSHLLRRYGLTPEQWDEMFAAQGQCCAICGGSEPGSSNGWETDHCHHSGAVRFILCTHCNRGLGAFKDNPALMRKAADMLEDLQSQVDDQPDRPVEAVTW